MILKKQKGRLNSKSQEIQEILAERLDKLCKFLDDEYDINAGGCCYVAYCLAKLLSKDQFDFKVIIYEEYELGDKFSKVFDNHYHYAIDIGNYIINSAECDEDESLYKNTYYNVKASEILDHYKNHSWNDYYNSSKNRFISKTIQIFYDDLTKDLREK